MKKIYLISTWLVVCNLVYAQKQKRSKILDQYTYSDNMKAGKRLISGGTLVGLGGGLVAGGLIVSSNTSSKDNKATVQAMTITGGMAMLVGGILISSAGSNLIIGGKNGQASLRLKGSGLALLF